MRQRQRAGALQESDGSTSIRRILSALFSLSAIFFWYQASSGPGSMPAFYSGTASATCSLILLFFTTWTDLSATAAAIRGQGPMYQPGTNYPEYLGSSSFQTPSGGVPIEAEEPEK